MLSVEDWAEIRRLHRAEELPIKMIARTLGVSRNTVRAALAADGPPRYVRVPAGSAVDAFEPRIREQLPPDPASRSAFRRVWSETGARPTLAGGTGLQRAAVHGEPV